MLETISQNKALTIGILWAVVILIALLAGWRKAVLMREYYPETVPVETYDQPADLLWPTAPASLVLTVEDRMTEKVEEVQQRLHKDFLLPGQRIHMRNRFLAPTEGSDAMAEQIVQDQAVAHEQPGAVVTDLTVTPEATTYYHLRETVDRFTFIIGKDGFMSIMESNMGGADMQTYAVPAEWAEPMSVLVLEVARLRHG